MPRFQIIPFDVDTASSDEWMALHVHRRVIAADCHPDDPILSDAECEFEMRRADPLWDARHWLALDGADAVGFAGAWFRRAGTPYALEHARFLKCYGDVAATARRKGIGTLLLQPVHTLMRALDKSVLTLSAHTNAGHAFLTRMGAAAKHSTVECRALLGDLDWPRLHTWENVSGGLGLTFECYAGRVPREALAALLPAFTALLSDIPLGALDAPPIRLEIESYDQWYESMARSGGAHHLVLLREPGGRVVGMSDASWDSRSPRIAYQMYTVVARPWRGRGVGRALKAALLRQIRSATHEAQEVRTWNAESNAPILSVNKHLGFRVLRHHADYQITRAELDARLPAAGGRPRRAV
jgi:GNAT superfamily N-acetyltransferase